MKTEPVSVVFKGSRQYVHGTTVYSLLARRFSQYAQHATPLVLDMTMHDFATSACELVYADDGDVAQRPADGVFEFRIGNQIAGWLRETGETITEREASLEDAIVAQCRVDDDACSIADWPGGNAIDVLIAMTKHLHNVAQPRDGGRWVLGRLQLVRWLTNADASRLRVQIKQLLGNRLSKCDISSGAEPLGQIYFTVVAR